MRIVACYFLAVIIFAASSTTAARFKPTWESLDTRVAPGWFDEAKIGIFIHWGVFSVPSFDGEWFWQNWKSGNKECIEFMTKNFRPGFTYADFAKDFKAEFYNASQWAELFKNSGANYVVLTSKHHEGFTLWPSSTSFNWNAMDVGPHKDLLGELAGATRQAGLHFGVYHSLYEWFNPIYLKDRKNLFATQDFVSGKTLPELYELVNNYKPDIIWSDGDWEATPEYWNATNFLAWLYNDSPVKDSVLVNDRWGLGATCKHGDFYNCADRYNPGVLLPHKWESAMTLDRGSWGYRRNMKIDDVLTLQELLTKLVRTVSCNGNLLVNVGPTASGTIDSIFQERLLQMGEWLKVNGEAIYGTKPWVNQNDTLDGNVWYTSKGNSIYAIVLETTSDTLTLGALNGTYIGPNTEVSILGSSSEVKFTVNAKNSTITLPCNRPSGVFTLKFTPKSNFPWPDESDGVTI